ncbi:MAG TPA: sigma-70 family RNA polymerase sigma factor [Solirubrobacteraceae bacterium]|nr:sigma-70 family RNA polymerase sigma factor [Solirubrobacteraceae bacterium]
MSALPVTPRATDEHVVRRLRSGDDTAFDALVARHRPAMLAFARKVLGEHRAAADDVVQEALIRAYRALRRDARRIDVRPWLLTLTRNCALDEIRRIRSYPLPPEEVDAAAAHGEPPERILTRRAHLREIVRDVATLPDEQRHALVRHAVDGAGHADIAAELGVTPAASRMLVVRARAELVKTEEARNERCDSVRDQLLRAHSAKRRAPAQAHRHLIACAGCRSYRSELRAVGSALRLLQPGPLLVLAALAGAKAAATKMTLGAAGGAAPAGLAAAVSAVAIGGTVVFAPGDPSPVDVRSRALPDRVVRAGEPLPKGTAIVATRVDVASGSRSATLACPPGLVVADLLPPGGGRVDLGYAPSTVPGRSSVARVRIRSRGTQQAGLAVLCRRPVRGSIVPRTGAGAATTATAAVCTRTVQLRKRPGGRIEASGRMGQPVTVLRRAGGWTRLRTDLGQTGWVPRAAVCSRP